MTSASRHWSKAQFEAIHARGENVIVSAGAGSGKTSVLVERVVECVTSDAGLDLTQVLVVTFTEAAAAEMRRRIGGRLKELLDAAVGAGDYVLVRRLNRLLDQLDQAQISTLHSFCMQVVRQNYLTLEIEPSFGMLGEDDSVLLKSECLETVIEQILHGEAGFAFRMAMEMFGARNVTEIAPLIFRLDGFSRSQAHPRDWLANMSQNFIHAKESEFNELPWTGAFAEWCTRLLGDALQNLEEAARISAGIVELEAYADNANILAPLVLQALQSTQERKWEEAARFLSEVDSQKSPRAKEHPLKEYVQSLRSAAIDGAREVLDILGRGTKALQEDIVALAGAVSTLVQLVIRFQEEYLERKRELSMLDFNDLEHFAYAILTDESTGEAQRLQSQFGEIFVDEFQDTSPIQDALVSAVGRNEGNVFVVGDVKQSIYRFRMAEPSLFLNKYYGRTKGIRYRAIHLTENYRSRTSVVNTVNHLFSQILSESFGGAAYDEHARMVRAANYPDDPLPSDFSTPVEVHLLERHTFSDTESAHAQGDVDRSKDSDTSSNLGTSPEVNVEGAADEAESVSREDLLAIEREARVMAARIAEWMGRGASPRRQVWDAAGKTLRPLEYRDIVVLLRSVKGRMTPLLDVFREFGIPAYGVTSTGFYGSLEVQWLLSTMSAIDNPRREIELVATLRSPMFLFSDSELAKIRLAAKGNFYDALREASKIDDTLLAEKVKSFFHQLNQWRKLSRRATTEEVVRQVLRDTGLHEYVMAMPGGRVRSANVETLLERIRAYDRTSTEGLFGFVARARELLEHEIDLGEARTLAESEDVVRIMTIHQSKGLEFPVVFVADLGKMFYRDTLERSLPLHRELGFGPMRIEPQIDQRWRTVPSIAIEELETTEFLAEEARILYVAITRAREQLVLVASARNLADRIATAVRSASMPDVPYEARVLLRAKSAMDWILYALWRHKGASEALLSALPQEVEMTEKPPLVASFGAEYEVSVWPPEAVLSISPGGEQSGESDSGENLQAARIMPETLFPLRRAIETRDEAALYGLLRSIELPSGEQAVVWVEDAVSEGPPAKVSATDLRRLWTARNHKKRAGGFATRATAEGLLEDPVWVKERTVTGRERGLAFHAVIEHINFGVEKSRNAVAAELERLVQEQLVKEEDLAASNIDDILSFLHSPLGSELGRAARILREQPFFHRIDLSTGDYVTVQGVMDCLAELPDKWILIDYKTDKIGFSDVEETALQYSAQISVYLEVAQALVGPHKPIEAWLYFVGPGVPIRLNPVEVRDLFEVRNQ